MDKKKLMARFPWVLVLIITLLVFRHWFGFGTISAGDLGFFYSVNIKEYWQPLLSWETFRGSGLGGYAVPFQHPFFLNLILGLLGHFFDFNLIERLVWFWPILIFSFFSSWYLVKSFLPANVFLFFGSLVFVFNTYFLMMVGGGQITVALAYAVFPLVLALFLRLVSGKLKLNQIILFSLALSLLVAFDLRFAYLFFLVVLFYVFFDFFFHRLSLKNVFSGLKKYFLIFLPAGLVAVGLHLGWLLPLFFSRRPSLPTGYEDVGWVEFLSFADFSHSFSLLQPNWPEGIFGKTYFTRPEFLIMPILAFSSLLFLKNPISKSTKSLNFSISYFALLGLIGAFLAKGSRPPFGVVYLWLFDHFPGFNMFRDPTKFYTLVALSYSVLIPLSVSRIYQVLTVTRNTRHVTRKKRVNLLLANGLLFGVTCYLLLLIRPAWLGQLGGTFKTREVPQEYLTLKDFIESQDKFYRTLWIPRRERFGFYSNHHPAVSAEGFVTDSVCREPFCSLKTEMPEVWGKDCFPNDRCYVRELSYFLNPQTEEILRQMAVKYVIVPFDSEGEIFLGEREYNPQQREEVEQFLDAVPWLRKITLIDRNTALYYGGISIYELSKFKDHFCFAPLTNLEINKLTSWKMINPTKYLVTVEIDQTPAELVFSETYDELWQARIGEEIIPSVEYNTLNSFILDQAGDFEVMVEFMPQKYVYWGLVVSGISLLTCIIYLFRHPRHLRGGRHARQKTAL